MEHSGFTSRSVGTVSGVFFSKTDADNAFRRLVQLGHTPDDISVLMSDETVSRNKNPVISIEPGQPAQETMLSKAADAVSDVIISITSLISLPGLGISISQTLQRKLAVRDEVTPTFAVDEAMAGSGIPDTHINSYGGHMQEGGIIISVDPRNTSEKKTIIRIFHDCNGHDILGDDGYTELD